MMPTLYNPGLQRRYSERGRRHAFTLIELLVVISIIALLIGMLLPVLGGARSAARTTKCSTQLQSVSTLTASFTTDRKDQAPLAGRLWTHTVATFCSQGLPPGLTYYYESGPGSIRRPMPFFATIAEYAGVDFDRSSLQAMRTQLGFPGEDSPAASGYFKFVRCPDDRTFDHNDLNHVGNSLLPNDLSWTVSGGLGELSSYMLNEWALGESPSESTRLLGRLYRAQNPSMIAYVADGEPRVFEPPQGINYLLFFDEETQPGYTLNDYNAMYRSYAPAEQFSNGFFYQFGFPVDYSTGNVRGPARHGRAINITFLDGHVRTVPLNEDAFQGVLISDP
jgi:prepilin-type N-terminal cleavage/methylation domain-containing protein/prepilin-type processing-associated H-X9-DG protein